ncbi:hypothetical protein [Parazoarcus communis]|nr:hypothetical protein [Parazoarcus communis]
MSVLDAEFIESKVLPLVIAFAGGVLLHSICADYRMDTRLAAARNTIYQMQTRADACAPTYANAYLYPQEVTK